MKTQSNISLVTEWILKIAIVFFLFKIFYYNQESSFFESKFISGLLGVLKFILFIGISMGVVLVKKNNFKIVGFLIIFIGSLYFLLTIISESLISFKYVEYILLMAISIYYLLRKAKPKKKKIK